ncbi:hypothetical protein COGO111638_12505 [Corynebacterium gottingense]
MEPSSFSNLMVTLPVFSSRSILTPRSLFSPRMAPFSTLEPDGTIRELILRTTLPSLSYSSVTTVLPSVPDFGVTEKVPSLFDFASTNSVPETTLKELPLVIGLSVLVEPMTM